MQGWPFGQTMPHWPQLFASMRLSDSQPLAGFLSQSLKLALQVKLHIEPTQAAAPLGATGQALPQPAQLFGSVRASTSQPSAGLPLQSRKPLLQAKSAQAPPRQPAMAFGRLQVLPQAPQLRASPWSDTSQPFCAFPSQSA